MKRMRSTVAERDAVLGAVDLFSPLTPEARRPLAQAGELRRAAAGDLLFRQDAVADGFLVIAEGRVRVSRTGGDGREQVLHAFGRGDICAEVPVFQGGTYPASGYAETAVRYLYIPADAFREAARRHPDMLLGMLAALSQRLRIFVNLIDDLSLKDVPARAAKFLLDAAVHQGVRTFRLPVTKAAMAARIGTVPETLSRVLGRMRRDLLITVEGRSITILDRDGLINLAAGLEAHPERGR